MARLGHYEIVSELGRGGMGVVYRGFDTMIRRDVALKTIRLFDVTDAQERQHLQDRLEREAQSAGRLSHPNIVTIYQIGYDTPPGGQMVAFIAMEFVAGPTLQDRVSQNPPLDRRSMVNILMQTAEALDYAHSQGVVHRDVKPANLLLSLDGRVKVTDFGIAKISAKTLTQSGTMMGSPYYMAPEQVRAEGVDGRADQYSLAVVAYELLSGRRPFNADSFTALVYQIAHEETPMQALEQAGLPMNVSHVMRRAMSKQAASRYDSCRAMVGALAMALETGTPIPAAKPLTSGLAQAVGGAGAGAGAGVGVGVGAGTVVTGGLGTPSIAGTTSVATKAAGGMWMWFVGVAVPVSLVTAGVYVWSNRTPVETPIADAPAVTAPPAPAPVAVARPAQPEEIRRMETVRETPVAPPPRVEAVKPPPVKQEPVKPEPPKPAPPAAAVAPVAVKPAEPPPAAAPPPKVEEVKAPVVKERTEPRLIRKVDPAYTEAARRAGLQGKVAYRVSVNTAGVPERLELVRGLESGLDRHAADAIAQWRFQPATEDGHPVPWVGIVEVEFRLINAPTGRPPSLRPGQKQ